MTVHFSGLKAICQSLSHLSSAARSCCRIDVSRLDVMRRYRSESSANSLMSDDVTSGISLINDKNNSMSTKLNPEACCN